MKISLGGKLGTKINQMSAEDMRDALKDLTDAF